ncbi:MAG TPA: hypothetical protein VFT69_13800 [Pseudolabrys sp.]|nr:hypothetical protein [Pseudolabrys sp.]
MLNWLSRRLRLRAAWTLAVVYAFCTIAPPVALAFTDGSAAAHCLLENADGVPHVHAQKQTAHGVSHLHAANIADNHAHVSGVAKIGDEVPVAAVGCCGLFSAPGIFRIQNVLFADVIDESPTFFVLDDDLAGRGPDRLHRPPIAF